MFIREAANNNTSLFDKNHILQANVVASGATGTIV